MSENNVIRVIVNKNKIYINPILILSSVWVFVSILYVMYLSPRLYYSIDKVFSVAFFVVSPALISYFLLFVFRSVVKRRKKNLELVFGKNEIKKIRFIFFGLVTLSLIEFAIEGYIPLISKMRGASISHFDFGIPSVHGFLMAGFLSLSTIALVLYQQTKNRLYLYVILYTFFWAMLIVSRKVFMVGVTQWVFVYLCLNRVSFLKVMKVVTIALIVVIAFGMVGDIRSGAGHINDLGGFKSDSLILSIPGLNWIYLYMTTPLHNFIYATQNAIPEYNILYTRTFNSLVPSIVVEAINGSGSRYDFAAAASNVGSWFESESFNVSTAMLQPYIDNGWIGVQILMALLGVVSGWVFFSGSGAMAFFSLITISTACVLSIYSDNFTNLNFIGQFIFYILIFMKFRYKNVRLI